MIELSFTFHDLILPDALTGQCQNLSRQLKIQNAKCYFQQRWGKKFAQ